MAVSDYPNGQAPHSALVEWGGSWVDPALVPELEFVRDYCEARGVSFRINQGYRWLGVPADANVYDSDDTSDGTANQWYVLGVNRRGGPSAATPGYSNHGRGLSVDVGSDGPDWQAVRDEAFRLVGWDRDVPGESWHYTKKRPALVDLSTYTDTGTPEETDEATMKILWVTVDGKPTHAYLCNGIQTVYIENPTDAAILKKYINDDTPEFSGGEYYRLTYYLDLLRIQRAGQPHYGERQPSGKGYSPLG